MMASPTAIPHPETSAHHHHRPSITQSDPSSSPPAALPSASSPRGSATAVFGARPPIYTQAHAAGRALSLGTAGLSVSPTTPWSAAGPSSATSIKDRVAASNSPSSSSAAAAAAASLTSPVLSRAQAQRDYFPENIASSTTDAARRHSRAASTSAAAATSSVISAADLSPSSDGPVTPRFDSIPAAASLPGGGMALGRVPSLPLGSSFDQLKAQRTNWGAAGGGGGGGGTGWGGLASLRGSGRLPDDASSGPVMGNNASSGATGRVGGLFRKFSLSSGSANPPSTSPPAAHRSHSLSVGAVDMVPAPAPVPSPPSVAANAAAPASPPRGPSSNALPTQTRGRRPSNSQSGGLGGGAAGPGGSVKRRPSPMGERLLMGHFSHH